MSDELASANVNRAYSLAASSIAIFTFLLFFLYPRFASGEVDDLLYQATLVVMGVATFSFVYASFMYYCVSIGNQIDDARRAQLSRRADCSWLVGITLLFLAPSLVLFALELVAVALVWFALWLSFVFFLIRYFPLIQRPAKRI